MSDMERDARRREVRAAGGTRLTVADLINVGVFGAVYFALVGVAALASMAVFGVAGNILLPAIAAVLAGVRHSVRCISSLWCGQKACD